MAKSYRIATALLLGVLCDACGDSEATTDSACDAYMAFVDNGNDGTRTPEEARDEWANEVHAEAKDIPALGESSTELLATYTSYAEDGAPSDATWDGSAAFTEVCVEAGSITDS